MWPATSWEDEHARAWSVMGRARERQQLLRNKAIQARRRHEERETKADVDPAALAGAKRDAVAAEWGGSHILLAFLFALPSTDAMQALDANVDAFDQRTGDVWDLFFPGYYRQSHEQPSYEDRPIGHGGISQWFFNALGFDILRREIEEQSRGRWMYSGDTDLVLVGALLPEEGDPLIDWASTISGGLTDRGAGVRSMTLGAVIQRISRDLERTLENPNYGVDAVVEPAGLDGTGSATREFMVDALATFAAECLARVAGA
jgi:hypothetical protein